MPFPSGVRTFRTDCPNSCLERARSGPVPSRSAAERERSSRTPSIPHRNANIPDRNVRVPGWKPRIPKRLHPFSTDLPSHRANRRGFWKQSRFPDKREMTPHSRPLHGNVSPPNPKVSQNPYCWRMAFLLLSSPLRGGPPTREWRQRVWTRRSGLGAGSLQSVLRVRYPVSG